MINYNDGAIIDENYCKWNHNTVRHLTLLQCVGDRGRTDVHRDLFAPHIPPNIQKKGFEVFINIVSKVLDNSNSLHLRVTSLL